MQILWRYILGQYAKVFTLCVIAFVTFLLVMRMKETAEFATLGAPLHQLFLYVLYQFPFILPIAIPISCLISSILLVQRLSHNSELTALRSSGLSFKQIFAPILTGGLLLSVFNFYAISEISTNSLLATKKMIQDLSSFNPLLLLKNSQFLKFKDIYVEIDLVENSLTAKNATIFLTDKKNNRIGLFYAQSLEVSGDQIKGKNTAFISNFNLTNEDSFDNLIIDSQKESSTPISEFIQLLKDTRFRIPYDHLQLSLLLIQKKKIHEQISQISSQNTHPELLEQLQIHKNKCDYEIMRRSSLGFAPFTFSLLGAAFGIRLGRTRSKRNLFIIILLAAMSCACFFLAKSSNQSLWQPASLFYIPQVLIITASIWHLARCSKGKES